MSKGHIVALVPDLFFGVRVGDVVRQLGYTAQLVDRGEQLAAALAPPTPGELPALVIIDIAAPPAAWEAHVRALKADPDRRHVPVLAFGAHLDVERQRLARQAGCDRVVANSKFNEALAGLVDSLARPAAAEPAQEDATDG